MLLDLLLQLRLLLSKVVPSFVFVAAFVKLMVVDLIVVEALWYLDWYGRVVEYFEAER